MTDTRLIQASRLMDAFAAETGLTSTDPARRYLWTDAHAVCNWLALEHKTEDPRYLQLAQALVAQVHDVLGHHRPDDARSGWISGLNESEGRLHPTSGGLRIGKPQLERPASAPEDQHAEWQQDGQYFHYLTKWMHALYRLAQRTGDCDYSRWAVELAVAAYRGFRSQAGPPRLYWKMSIDLSYPLVASSGHHDPLDGLITCLVLSRAQEGPALTDTIAGLRELCQGRSWATDDPLGIGGLLFDSGRLAQLHQNQSGTDSGVLSELLVDVVRGLSFYVKTSALQQPASNRLAFRELGLAIGLQAFDIIAASSSAPEVRDELEELRPYLPLRPLIEAFWLAPENQRAATWIEHQDINAVMLATSLTAPGFLSI
jgi:hypothetical protein